MHYCSYLPLLRTETILLLEECIFGDQILRSLRSHFRHESFVLRQNLCFFLEKFSPPYLHPFLDWIHFFLPAEQIFRSLRETSWLEEWTFRIAKYSPKPFISPDILLCAIFFRHNAAKEHKLYAKLTIKFDALFHTYRQFVFCRQFSRKSEHDWNNLVSA